MAKVHVPRSIYQVTEREAVDRACEEYDGLGRDTFIALYGYGRSKDYFLLHEREYYDSKPIMGVAFAYQHKGEPPLRYNDFSGGEATVQPQFEKLGFRVVRKRDLPADAAARLFEKSSEKRDKTDQPKSVADGRRRVFASVMRRLGQWRFRRSLLNAYSARCAISGDSTRYVLEAAHIEPFRVRGLNAVSNGLLLRADLHILFDLGLIAVGHNYRLLISDELTDTPYEKLRAVKLRLPARPEDRPSARALETHRRLSKAH